MLRFLNKRNNLEKAILGIVCAILGFIFFVNFTKIFPWLIVPGIFAIFIFEKVSTHKKRTELLKNYENLKENLCKNPQSADLIQKVLKAGREYYASLRHDNRLTIYDEQAISNDLAAIFGTQS